MIALDDEKNLRDKSNIFQQRFKVYNQSTVIYALKTLKYAQTYARKQLNMHYK